MNNKGGCHVFPSKFFCLTVPRNFVTEYFCVSKKRLIWKKFEKELGTSRFSVGIFLSHSAEFS